MHCKFNTGNIMSTKYRQLLLVRKMTLSDNWQNKWKISQTKCNNGKDIFNESITNSDNSCKLIYKQGSWM